MHYVIQRELDGKYLLADSSQSIANSVTWRWTTSLNRASVFTALDIKNMFSGAKQPRGSKSRFKIYNPQNKPKIDFINKDLMNKHLRGDAYFEHYARILSVAVEPLED